MTADLLIDEAGQIWAAGSAEIHQRFAINRSESDLTSYLIRNLGHVRVRLSNKNNDVYIAFRPGELTNKTIFTTCDLINECGCNRYIIEFVVDVPELSLVTDFEDAVAILIESNQESVTCANTKVEREWRRPQFFRQSLSFERLKMEPRLQRLATRHRAWSHARGRVTSTRAKPLFEKARDRHLLARVRKDNAIFETIGEGYSSVNAGLDLLGRRVDEHPDPAYGRWVADCMLDVIKTTEPVFELVEVTVTLPNKQPVRVRHERLLLPWAGRGSVYVTSSAEARIIFPAA